MRNLNNLKQPFAPLRRNGRKTDPFSKILSAHLQPEELADLETFLIWDDIHQRRLPDQFFNPEGILIGLEMKSQAPAYLPVEHLMRHCAVIGKTRSGKTTLMVQIINSILQRTRRPR
jgi:DNA helicase HerA-like ATPase